MYLLLSVAGGGGLAALPQFSQSLFNILAGIVHSLAM